MTRAAFPTPPLPAASQRPLQTLYARMNTRSPATLDIHLSRVIAVHLHTVKRPTRPVERPSKHIFGDWHAENITSELASRKGVVNSRCSFEYLIQKTVSCETGQVLLKSYLHNGTVPIDLQHLPMASFCPLVRRNFEINDLSKLWHLQGPCFDEGRLKIRTDSLYLTIFQDD